jgi:hypothetical protein
LPSAAPMEVFWDRAAKLGSDLAAFIFGRPGVFVLFPLPTFIQRIAHANQSPNSGARLAKPCSPMSCQVELAWFGSTVAGGLNSSSHVIPSLPAQNAGQFSWNKGH